MADVGLDKRCHQLLLCVCSGLFLLVLACFSCSDWNLNAPAYNIVHFVFVQSVLLAHSAGPVLDLTDALVPEWDQIPAACFLSLKETGACFRQGVNRGAALRPRVSDH